MSTSHALIDLVEEISESMDNKLYTLVVSGPKSELYIFVAPPWGL